VRDGARKIGSIRRHLLANIALNHISQVVTAPVNTRVLQNLSPHTIIVDSVAKDEGALPNFNEAMPRIKSLCALVVIEYRQIDFWCAFSARQSQRPFHQPICDPLPVPLSQDVDLS
jgi:hypothetical protein